MPAILSPARIQFVLAFAAILPLLVSVTPLSASADSGIPLLGTLEVTGTPRAMIIAPGGGGPTLGDIGVTIRIQVVDFDGLPVAGYPFQDVRLTSVDPGTVEVCSYGMTAAANTNGEGMTQISGPFFGGGFSEAGVRVSLAGELHGPVIALGLRSPDYNSDLVVDLADIAEFADDFLAGSYRARSDFNDDGTLDLADIGFMATQVGTACPQ